MRERLLKVLSPAEMPTKRRPLDPGTRAASAEIVEDVRARGEAALREHGERLGDCLPGARLVLDRDELERDLADLPGDQRALLERTAARIRHFAEAQRAALSTVDVAVPGGRAGHGILPVERVGCYAPGGRFPLPSSVLMTAVTARVAGVTEVWVASPRPTALTRAAAAIAGADGLLAVGGAQAVAALAFGTVTPAVDLIAGPGNRWVTAAKQHLSGEVGIDLLAGPSELVVIADAQADPERVAADLLAQAEHDVDALPILISTSAELVDGVEVELERQLADPANRDTAVAALAAGFAVVTDDLDQACGLSDRLAPEHLALAVRDPQALRPRLRNYGALFLGESSAEVFGDYGAGPNHVLPTGSTARFQSGLSVFTFLRTPTWLTLTDPVELAADAEALGHLEGLTRHARSAELRSSLRPGHQGDGST